MQSLIQLSEQLGERLLQQGEVLATAESCTGGGVANIVTEVAGSSAWFDRAFVTYSNEAKQEMLGVAEKTLA
ncbi:nicotinamide-nucleotide amidohydrolase family protein, partial [Vibrio alginolyticus]